MKSNKIAILFISVCSAALLLAGCVKERNTLDHAEGAPVVFGASTLWQNEIADSRTEYSGVDEDGNPVNSGSDFERIDWVPGSDWFSVICAVAGNGPKQDYSVRSKSEAAQNSYANAYSVSGNGLQWGSEGADHYFYAFYPAPGMESNYDFGADKVASASNFSFTSTTTGGVPSAAITATMWRKHRANFCLELGQGYRSSYKRTNFAR